MKLDGVNNISFINAAKRKKTSGAGGADFSSFIDEEETSHIAAPMPMAALNPYLSLQEVAEKPETDIAHAKKKGFTLLDQLDELKLSLLSGTISSSNMRQLKEAIGSERASVNDKNLTHILDAIEVRAAVELAKLEKAQKTA